MAECRRVHPGERVLAAFLAAHNRGNQLVLGRDAQGRLTVYEVEDPDAAPAFLRERLDERYLPAGMTPLIRS